MIIKEFSELNKELINSIRILEDVCKEHDGLNGDMFLDNSLNFNKNIKNLFMAYEDDVLISVLYMFIPTKAEAEISAYTHPSYRKRGYFKALVCRASEEAKKHDIKDLLFVCESQSKDGKETIKNLKAAYDFTEYLLKFNKDSKGLVSSNLAKVRKASDRDAKKVIDICMDAFDDSFEVSQSFTMKTLESKDREIYVSELNNEIIGACSVSYNRNDIFLFGFAIAKANQGKGMGKETLIKLIEVLCSDENKNIFIEVDSGNDIAFNLYKKCGFEIKTAFEYHKKNIL
ncbi:GNAT family N-acetyltransferase [Clostridium folliculivorans]|uniref:Acetyltransferase n=1 Tax=Clostridium folliculivorans TaxID=2886038 RepID=A0A9W6DAD2_9CLOT|nr:GNAT family N-acetyltransferase [Clostridium folliculivorans]GKU24841.1 acetyltransferase [Clostridium folliculivorans]GKU30939.1 acetyltransferase [Clostridium folliculivorans]